MKKHNYLTWTAPRTLLASGLVAILLLCGATRTAADQYTDQIQADQQQLSSEASAAADARAQISKAQDQAAALRKLIDVIDSQIATTNDEVNAAQAKLYDIDTQLSAAQDDLFTTTQRLKGEKKNLAVELVALYKASKEDTPINNFLSKGDFNSFWEQVVFIGYINRQETILVNAVQADENTVAADVARIGAEKQAQQATLSQLHGILANLDATKAQRQAAVAQLQTVEATYTARLQESEAAATQLQSEISQLQAEEAAATAAGGGSGQFQWPESGPITQGFGCTPYVFEPWDPNCPSRHFHSGLDIAASCGTHIGAADAGIAYTYWSNWGYGDHIIIVHGNGWSTVYGHMSGFAVSNGQTVGRGQLIGYEGSTGNSTGCHLHFEIRRNDVPQNPYNYLS